MDTVRIEWTDAAYSEGTWSKKAIKDFGLKELVSVGLLVENRPDCYVVAGQHDTEDDQYRLLEAIPKVCIKKVIKLRKKGDA